MCNNANHSLCCLKHFKSILLDHFSLRFLAFIIKIMNYKNFILKVYMVLKIEVIEELKP